MSRFQVFLFSLSTTSLPLLFIYSFFFVCCCTQQRIFRYTFSSSSSFFCVPFVCVLGLKNAHTHIRRCRNGMNNQIVLFQFSCARAYIHKLLLDASFWALVIVHHFWKPSDIRVLRHILYFHYPMEHKQLISTERLSVCASIYLFLFFPFCAFIYFFARNFVIILDFFFFFFFFHVLYCHLWPFCTHKHDTLYSH